jgi:hypothetical protein
VSKKRDKLKRDIIGCCRCGQKHHQALFKELVCPVETVVKGERVLIATHWAKCSRTGDPILMIEE